MSGHSKWATIKHKKGAADHARGKLFAKLIRQVEVAAREGGGDPDMNPTLRTMYQKARDASVPLDTIERAIKRGTGDLEGVIYEQITYEGYAPGRCGGADRGAHRQPQPHRLRGAQHLHQVRRIDGRARRRGLAVRAQGRCIVVPRHRVEDDLMLVALDAGAEDLVDEGDAWRVTSPPTELNAVRTALEEAGVRSSRPTSPCCRRTVIALDDAEAAKQVLRLIDALEDNDDVQACTPTSMYLRKSSRPPRPENLSAANLEPLVRNALSRLRHNYALFCHLCCL